MRRLLSYLLISAACLPAADLRLDDALRAVREQPSGGDTRLQIAQTRIAMLEAMSRRRLELRPQLGLFSLANPIGLVASMGLGLLGGRNAVPPAVMADARIDLLAAEAALDRQQFQREVETT